MARRAALAAMAASLIAMAPPAGAAELHEPRTDFRVEVAAPGARVCVIVPDQLHHAACAELDKKALRAATAMHGPEQVGMALLLFADWQALVTLTTTEAKIVTSEEIDSYMNGVAKEVGARPGCRAQVHGSNTSSRYDLIQIGDVPVARYHVTLDCGPDDPAVHTSRMVGFLFPASNGSNSLALATDPDHGRQLAQVAAIVAGTARGPRFETRHFGQPAANRRAYHLGKAVGQLLFFLVVGAVVAVLVVRDRRRRAKLKQSIGPPP